MLTEQEARDLKVLAGHSRMAASAGPECDFYEADFSFIDGRCEELSFHPNGRCGCIRLNDEYMFGIRCDHLMWAEGCCEGIEGYWDEDAEGAYPSYNAILVYGNHKGSMSMGLLVLHTEQGRKHRDEYGRYVRLRDVIGSVDDMAEVLDYRQGMQYDDALRIFREKTGFSESSFKKLIREFGMDFPKRKRGPKAKITE